MIKTPGSIRPEDEKTVHDHFEDTFTDARRRSGFLRRLLDDAHTLYTMLRDPAYRFDWATRAKVIFGLLYFVSPIDFVPDFVPGVGFIDDAVVLTLVVRSLGEAVKRYRQSKSISTRAPMSPGDPKTGTA
jgi:uncharacterized membrane protein YkvA (DUF1232 family)